MMRATQADQKPYLLNTIHIALVLLSNHVDSKAQVTESTTTANSMKVGLSLWWEVEIDNDIDCLDIDATGDQI